MSKQLIFRNDAACEKAKRELEIFFPLLNKLHNELVKIGVSFTESEILNFLKALRNVKPEGDTVPYSIRGMANKNPHSVGSPLPPQKKTSYLVGSVLSLLKDKLIETAGTKEIGGLTINKEKLKELIELPDITALNDVIDLGLVTAFSNYSASMGLGNEGALIELGKNGYYIVDNADGIIKERYSYYTTNEKGAKILKVLQEICEGINSFDSSFRQIILDTNDHHSPIKKLNNGKYVPSYEFINAYEKI